MSKVFTLLISFDRPYVAPNPRSTRQPATWGDLTFRFHLLVLNL
jgi:hypothetical protein